MMRLGVFFCVILIGSNLIGQSIHDYTLKDWESESQVILEGEVVSKKAIYGQDGLIYTQYEIQVFNWFKGKTEENSVRFISLGGIMEEEALIVCPSLHFNVGDQGIIGLKSQIIDWIDPAIMRPVSADMSWIGLDYEQNTASGFSFESYKIDELRTRIQNLVGEEMTRIKEVEQRELPEIMITISNVTPLTTQAGRGKEITISGSGFGSTRGNGLVLFRDVHYSATTITRPAVLYNSWSDTEIKAIVPYNAGNGQVKVQNNAGMLSAASAQSLTITYNVSNINGSEYVYHIDHDQDGNGGYNFKYSTNTANSGVDFTSIPAAVSAVERATASWNNGTKFTIFTETDCGTTSAQVPAKDDINVITFDNGAYDLDIRRGSSVLAALFSYYSKCTGNWEVMEFDLVIKRDGDPNRTGGRVDWEYGPAAPSRGEADFESVVLHELGHSHQLGHCRVTGSVMYPIIQLGSTVRNLTSSETDGGDFVQSQSTGYNPPVDRRCAHPFNKARRYFDYNAGNKCSIVLPLELLYFKAQALTSNSIGVNWLTFNEVEHDRVDLEVMAPRKNNWQVISSYAGKGGSQIEGKYEYLHTDLEAGTYLYRLAIFDKSGNIEYSDMVAVQLQSTEVSLDIYALNGLLSYTSHVESEDLLEINIYDLSGKRVGSYIENQNAGLNKSDVFIGRKAKGIYVISWRFHQAGLIGNRRILLY